MERLHTSRIHSEIPANNYPTYVSELDKSEQVRTQIYLSENQQFALTRLAKQRNCTKSSLIRSAVDAMLKLEKMKDNALTDEQIKKRKKAKSLVAGMWADRKDMEDVDAYVRKMRAARQF